MVVDILGTCKGFYVTLDSCSAIRLVLVNSSQGVAVGTLSGRSPRQADLDSRCILIWLAVAAKWQKFTRSGRSVYMP